MTESQARELCHDYAQDAQKTHLSLEPASLPGLSWVILVYYDTARGSTPGSPNYEWFATASTESELRLVIHLVERLTAIGYREGYNALERQHAAYRSA